METKKQTAIVSCDWLELFTYVKDDRLLQKISETEVNGYTITREGEGTAFFENRFIIKSGKKQIATLLTKPRASFINKRTALLKLANRCLYYQGWSKLASELLESLKLQYKGITRIDICADLKRFANGYRPHKLIKEYVTKSYGEDGYIHRKGSNEFSCHGSKDKGGISKMNYISFGSRKGNVRAYIYNKSKELREANHSKPWIKELWKENGLQETTKEDIWRCEISIKARGLNLLNFETGELFKLQPEYVDTQKAIEKIFLVYAKKYLNFSVQHGQKRAKDFETIKLFDQFEEIPVRPIYISEKIDAGKTEKMIVNKLEEYTKTYNDIPTDVITGIGKTIAFLYMLMCCKQQSFYREVNEQVIRANINHMKSFKSYIYEPREGDEERKLKQKIKTFSKQLAQI